MHGTIVAVVVAVIAAPAACVRVPCQILEDKGIRDGAVLVWRWRERTPVYA